MMISKFISDNLSEYINGCDIETWVGFFIECGFKTIRCSNVHIDKKGDFEYIIDNNLSKLIQHERKYITHSSVQKE